MKDAAETDPLAGAVNDLAAAIRELASAIRSTPGAKTVTTQIRPTPDHRDVTGYGRFGIAPVKAEES